MFDTDSEIAHLRSQILTYHISSVMTDVERAKLLGLKEGNRIREGAKIISPENLMMGENNWIGENAILDASGLLEIGNNNSIGLSVFVWTHDSHNVNLTGENTKENSHKIIRKKTKIGNNCFIAGHSIIMPGVTIGDGCIIAPMSVVYKDLHDGSVYTPYRDFVRYEKRIKKLEKMVKELTDKLI
ncbi:acyltransferase [Vibrio scophthalmi]|uniref:Maltose O-acetyltransferase n=1 Tax=Vibrio scophthalmi TaxID=45658 RepID=A0A1E3WJK6_9VIBR|nr:acyltransferase [Vibrio scophthalmi]ODS09940.1 Maltose O-acetyltransferase [Vibrio scophthalmi]